MTTFIRTGIYEGVMPLPFYFFLVIFMIQRTCHSILVMMSLLPFKCQGYVSYKRLVGKINIFVAFPSICFRGPWLVKEINIFFTGVKDKKEAMKNFDSYIPKEVWASPAEKVIGLKPLNQSTTKVVERLLNEKNTRYHSYIT